VSNFKIYVQPWVWCDFIEFKDAGMVTLPTSKHIATTSSACQVVRLRRPLSYLNQKQASATKTFRENISTIALTKNPAHTAEQVANIFTKWFLQAKHEFFKTQVGVCNFK